MLQIAFKIFYTFVISINILTQNKDWNLGFSLVHKLAISLKIGLLAALYPPSIIFCLLDWCNRKGHKCHRHEQTTSGNHWEWILRAKLKTAVLWSVFFNGGGYKAARSLISPGITHKLTGMIFVVQISERKFEGSFSQKLSRQYLSQTVLLCL